MTPLLDDPALGTSSRFGVAHEQQHIELLLTDIKHALFQNPLRPGDMGRHPAARPHLLPPLGWHEHPGRIPRLSAIGVMVLPSTMKARATACSLEPFALADRLVTNGEWTNSSPMADIANPACGWPMAGGGWQRESDRRAALLARRSALHPSGLAAARPQRARHPYLAFRGRCLCHLGGRAPGRPSSNGEANCARAGRGGRASRA